MANRDQSDKLSERDWGMWRMYFQGAPQREIAEKYGISQTYVSQRLAVVRKSIPKQTKDQVREKHIAQLDTLRRELFAITQEGPNPVFVGKDGDVAYHPETGEMVRDHAGRVAAMDRLVKFQEREAKLLGLDEPTKLEHSGEVTIVEATAVDNEIAKLVAELGVVDEPAPENADSE